MNETKISDGTKLKIKGARFAAVSANIKYFNRLCHEVWKSKYKKKNKFT